MIVQLKVGQKVRDSKGNLHLTEKGDCVETSSKSNRKIKESYNDFVQQRLVPIVKDILEDEGEKLDHKYEFYNSKDVIEVTDGKSGSGFSSSTEGSVNYVGWTSLGYFSSSGSVPHDRKFEKTLNDYIDASQGDAVDTVYKNNKDLFKTLNISDRDAFYDVRDALEQSGNDSVVDELYNAEQDSNGDTEVTMAVHVYFKNNDRSSNSIVSESYNCFVFAEYCFGTYYQFGSGVTTFEEEFDLDISYLHDFEKQVAKVIKSAVESLL